MTTRHSTDDRLLARILGRTQSLFTDDIAACHDRLAVEISGRRLLIAGASGSIGAAFVKQILSFKPAALHLVDLNENSLVELVRDLRSSDLSLPDDFRTVSVDYGSIEFQRFAVDRAPHDAFINFAAMKHVRSERDVYSLLRMIDVNVESLYRILECTHRLGIARVFSVSTDKSVRPANLMGATKNLMEQVLFSASASVTTTTARFANVAFSAGSLLDGFNNRLKKRQPLSAPVDVYRYFISHEEAGQLCMMSAFLGNEREVYFPRVQSGENLRSFAKLALLFLEENGYEALLCKSEREAIEATGKFPGKWPCYFSKSDTTGEKTVEEFHRDTDVIDVDTYRSVGVVREPPADRTAITDFLERVQQIRRSGVWSKSEVISALRAAVPELQHHELERDLDQKM